LTLESIRTESSGRLHLKRPCRFWHIAPATDNENTADVSSAPAPIITRWIRLTNPTGIFSQKFGQEKEKRRWDEENEMLQSYASTFANTLVRIYPNLKV